MKRQTIISKVSYYSPDNDQINLKRTFTKTLTSERVKFYFNSQHLICNLSPTSNSLMLFLAEHMDSFTNEIATTQITVRKYIEFRKRIGLGSCSEAVVKKGFDKLRKCCILITTPESGNNIVNPKYLYKGSEEERRLCVNRLLSYTIGSKWTKTNLQDALGVVIKGVKQ